MAKYKVTKIYVDKDTKEVMHEGREVEYTDKRAKELDGFIEKIESKIEKKSRGK